MSNRKPLIQKIIPLAKIKTESGTSAGEDERLASFKLPRDLTLGGLGLKTKKTFTPNLNLVRNKNKTAEALNPTPSTSGRGIQRVKNAKNDVRNRGNDKGRGKGRGKELIQSQGVFSDGIAEVKRGSSGYSRGGGGGSSDNSRDDVSAILEKPKLDLKKEIKVSKEGEEQTLKEVYQPSKDYSGLEPDFDDAPISLPYRTDIPLIKIKTEGIKTDFDAHEEETLVKNPENVSNKLEGLKRFNHSNGENIKEMLDNPKSKLLFFQFPECLPGFGVQNETETQKNQKQPDYLTNETSTNTNKCTLNDIDEGLIGKIVIYKSGRAKLHLGQSQFNIQYGIQKTFLQNVVSIETSDKNDGKMINLGQIDGNLLVTPDWEYLLSK